MSSSTQPALTDLSNEEYGTLKQELETVLQQDERVETNGTILENRVIELALDSDQGLIGALAENPTTNQYFFTEAGDSLVFKREEFVTFVSSKDFLSDSYTQFKNRIGLYTGDGYYSQKKDAVLAWPYKDCVLEGGQEDSTESRTERFWNVQLAPDKIDSLLSPKAFTNIERVGCDEKTTNISEDDNLFIRGNNLLALHSIIPRYENQVRCIYLDPPYNTGNDSFKYNDNFNRSTWLTFMKNRLEASKRLMSPDGVIMVQCDDNEQAYLKVLMDEVFGRENFVNTIAVRMSGASGHKMAHKHKRFPKQKEYILFYKGPEFEEFEEIDGHKVDTWKDEYNIFLENMTKEKREALQEIENRDFNSQEERNKAKQEANDIFAEVKQKSLSKKLDEMNFRSYDKLQKWKFENSYRIIGTKGSKSLVKRLKKLSEYPNQEIATEFSETGLMFYYIPDFNKEASDPRVQVVFSDENIYQHPCDLWTDISNDGGVAQEGGVKLPNGKKPEELLKRVVKMTTNPGDIVLDFFLGSGTTAAVAHKMERQYIGIEQLDYGENDPTQRLKNVINGDSTGISDEVGWSGGGDFVYAELMELNAVFIDQIQAATTSSELESVWEDMTDRASISYTVDVDKFEEHTDAFNGLSVENQKRFLLEVLDKNQLYVRYSDIEDSEYNTPSDVIEFNKEFYGDSDE